MPGGARTYVFTINSIPQDLTVTPVIAFPDGVVAFAVYQLERAPSTDHLHIQGVVRFKKSVSVGVAGKAFAPYKPFVERARGTLDQCVAYCTKNESRVGGPVQYGVLPKPGQRSDLFAVIQQFKDTKRTLEDILADDELACTYVKYHKGLERYRELRSQSLASRSNTVYVLYGPTGTHKTRLAMGGGQDVSEADELEARTRIYSKPFGDKWFDGYDGQIRLVLDEYTGWLPWAKLLQLLDIYPVRIEFKGGHTHSRWQETYITTNKPPRQWYKSKEQHWPALVRRVAFWVYCGVPDVSKWDWFTSYDEFAAHCLPVGADVGKSPDVDDQFL